MVCSGMMGKEKKKVSAIMMIAAEEPSRLSVIGSTP